jgi:hypothetical protein
MCAMQRSTGEPEIVGCCVRYAVGSAPRLGAWAAEGMTVKNGFFLGASYRH